MRWEYLSGEPNTGAAGPPPALRACIAVFSQIEFERAAARALARHEPPATKAAPAGTGDLPPA